MTLSHARRSKKIRLREKINRYYLTSTLRDAVAFTVLLVVLFFRPSGLFGSYEV